MTFPSSPSIRHTSTRSLWGTLICGVTVASLAAGCSNVSGETNSASPTATATSSTTGDAAATPSAAEGKPRFTLEGSLDVDTETVNAIIAHVEETTGRTFQAPPVIVGQTQEEFRARLEEHDDDQLTPEAAEIQARYYQAFGGSTMSQADLTALLAEEDLDSVGAYYEPEVDKVFVPPTTGDPAMDQFILAHELTHALDDQYVDLEAQWVDETQYGPEDVIPETNTVSSWVVDGRAQYVAYEWSEKQSEAADGGEETSEDAADAETSQEEGGEEQIPDGYPVEFLFQMQLPYMEGPNFVYANGGAKETWDELETLPASSENLLTRAGEDGASVPTEQDSPGTIAQPETDGIGEVQRRWVYGSHDILAALYGSNTPQTDDDMHTAIETAAAWKAGEAVQWGDETKTCVRVNLSADDEAGMTRLRDAFTAWAATAGGRTLEQQGEVLVLTGCAPVNL